MVKFASVNILLLVLCAAGFSAAIQCYNCKSENGEVSFPLELPPCGPDPNSYPTIECPGVGPKCFYFDITRADSTSGLHGTLRNCEYSDNACNTINPGPDYEVSDCRVCGDDLCNKNGSKKMKMITTAKIILLLVLCTAEFSASLRCFSCIESFEELKNFPLPKWNLDVSVCEKDDLHSWPWFDCEEENQCLYVEIKEINSTRHGVIRSCEPSGNYCDGGSVPGFEIVSCYECHSDFCNQDTIPPPKNAVNN